MPRIRTVKPEFWSSPDHQELQKLGPLYPWAKLLYIAMWNQADDHGRGVALPMELRSFAFPHDEHLISSADIRRSLGGIRRAFGVVFYTVRGRPYYSIPSWLEHQKIDKRSAEKYPPPEDGEDWDPDPCWADTPPDDQAILPSLGEDSAGPAEITPNLRCGVGGDRVDTARVSEDRPDDSASSTRDPSDSTVIESAAVADIDHYVPADTPFDLHKYTDSAGPARTSPNPRRDSGAGTGEQGNRGTGETDSEAKASSSGAAAPPGKITAQTVTAAWVDATTGNGVKPTVGMKGRVGKTAQELLDAGNDPDRVLAAAKQAGTKGYATIDRELTSMAGRQHGHLRTVTTADGLVKPVTAVTADGVELGLDGRPLNTCGRFYQDP